MGQALEQGIALCLSGGGYRAMLYHLGSLLRLAELGALAQVARISSVSGGSITAARLALSWDEIFTGDETGVGARFREHVVNPIRSLAKQTIDAPAIGLGVLLPGRISDRVESAYHAVLGEHTTLQDLPQTPRFVFCASNLQSGVLFRFSRPYMGDYRIGRIPNPVFSLAKAVTASSAFPPFLSPCVLELGPQKFVADGGSDLCRAPYTSRVVLSDGGVYDNLGLEPAFKRYDTLLVSDAGSPLLADPDPPDDWLRHSVRVASVVDSQVRALRKRILLDALRSGMRKGVYFGIRMNIADYPAPGALSAPFAQTQLLANVETRLAKLEDGVIERLINWGYASADAAYRTHVVPEGVVVPAPVFPYPASPIGAN